MAEIRSELYRYEELDLRKFYDIVKICSKTHKK